MTACHESASELLEQLEAETAAEEDLVRVHAPAHVERVREACRQAADEGSIVALDPDTKVSSASWDAALGSAGKRRTAQ